LKSYGEFLRVDGIDPSGLLSRPVLEGIDQAGPADTEAQTRKDDDRS